MDPLESFSLDETDRSSSRLRSVASYESFQPQAMACCHSLGAIAGSHGVSLFRHSKPQSPVMILSYAYHNSTVSSLSFQRQDQPFGGKDSSPQLLLASTRGTGVLVWDVSGHSLSPLWGRLGMEDSVESLSWFPDGRQVLAATTAAAACLWDLRQRPFRPQVRFGTQATSAVTRFCQIATAGEECAILDSSGVLRVYDTRITRPGSALSTVPAFSHAGIGLTSIKRSVGAGGHCWVTWGFDDHPEMQQSATVKVWGKAPESLLGNLETAPSDGEDYWFLDTSPDRTASTGLPVGCQLVGQCKTSNLVCARVCPSPIEDVIVTMGVDNGLDGEPSFEWTASLWKLGSGTSSEMTNVLSFIGGGDALTSNVVGAHAGRLRAVEVTIAPVSYEVGDEGDKTLLVSTLTSKGYVTQHSIPEVIPQTEGKEETAGKKKPMEDDVVTSARLFQFEHETTLNNAARGWNRATTDPVERGQPRLGDLEPLDSPSFHPSSGDNMTVPFDLEASPPYAKMLAGQPGPTLNRLIVPEHSQGIAGHTEGVAERLNTVAMMKTIETDRIPCPRLCGATFGWTGGGLVTFSSGDVRKVWSWLERQHPNRSTSFRNVDTDRSLGESQTANRAGYSNDGAKDPSNVLPRTLNDFDSMIVAARAAQWGSHASANESGTNIHLDGDLFDEESEGSSDSGGHEDDFLVEREHEEAADIYTQYFGTSPSLDQFASENLVADTAPQVSPQMNHVNEGTPFGVLAPVVRVSLQFDQLAMNGQSSKMALGLKLGDLPVHLPGVNKRPSQWPISQFPSDGSLNRDERAASDTLDDRKGDSEETFHGGLNFGMREHFSIDYSVPDFYVPLTDGQTKYRSEVLRPSASSVPSESEVNGSSSGSGLYVLKKIPVTKEVNKKLSKMKDVCAHNVSFCSSNTQKEKAEVWRLLGEVITMKLRENVASREGKSGLGSASFGLALVESLIQYYMSLGDVQMLATIVCVLRQAPKEDSRLGSLLPPGRSEQLNMFLLQYADLLFGWGLLVTRAEVLKHLSRTEKNSDTPQLTGDLTDVSAVGLVFPCSRCNKDTEVGNTVCQNCQDFAFRCVICETSVRGLSTVCTRCGHGGHIDHLAEWFATSDVCPSGCGCHCLATLTSTLEESAVLAGPQLPELLDSRLSALPNIHT